MNPWLVGVPAATAVLGAAAGFASVHPRSQLFGRTLCRTASQRQLAITFDDGPNPAITPKLLDLLDRFHARATFFLIGRFVRQCPALSKEIEARGHLIGNHTESHPNLFWLSREQVCDEMERCQQALELALGHRAKHFRPPYGFRNPWVVSAARGFGMQTVMWTLIPGDWRAVSADWLAARMSSIAQHAQKIPTRPTGDILCLHDGGHRALGTDRSYTLMALEYWLPRWRDLGLKFVTISEAVKIPAR
jgi:peptidoglycan/xylan/chitin deacetylase (PgdA/CDA1 family)